MGDFKRFLVSFIVFSVFRIIIPNKILGRETEVKRMIITSIFFGIADLVRRDIMSIF